MARVKITKPVTNIDSKSLDKYLFDIEKIDPVTSEEEIQLVKRIKKGDKVALNKLYEANLKFVVMIAKQYENKGLDLAQLINEGNAGLLHAARSFDDKRGFKFISHAVWWIRESILQGLEEQTGFVRLPPCNLG